MKGVIAIVLVVVVVAIGGVGCFAFLSPFTDSGIEKPDDFYLVMREMQSGYIDLCTLDENYYLQPEFYEDSWEIGKRYYEQHDYSRWVVHGHGAYPSNPHVVFKTDEVGEWIRFCTFYRTGWATETYQGVKLQPMYSDYFNVDIEPNEFLMVPTFPEISKDIQPYPWVYKLNVTVKIKQQPPKGTHTIYVNAVPPSEEKSKEWFWVAFRRDISPEQYFMLEECKEQQQQTGRMDLECEEWIEKERRNKYIAGGNIQVGPRLTITIDVV